MKRKTLKKALSAFLSLLMCMMTLLSISTPVFAATTVDAYMVDFPRDGDSNYSATAWGHSATSLMGGWRFLNSKYTTVHSIGTYNGQVSYCIEPGIGQNAGDTLSHKDETFWENYPSHLNPTISPDTIKVLLGRIMQYGYQGNVSTSWRSQNASDAAALSYPELKKYPHLKGNFGTAWQNQQREFADIPAPVLFTTNCLMPPRPGYADRVFTTALVSYPEITHIDEDKDFSPVIEKALALGGYNEDKPFTGINGGGTVMTGFGHGAVLGVADQVIEAVKSGAIRHFFLVGGCDGARPGRNYYTEFVKQTPADTVVLTLACGKYRFNDLDLGTIGGLPRLMDVGQCNDAYGAVRIALALADAFGCGVNDLPLSLVLSWYEQKAVCILLTLLYLGIRNIRLGPTLPAFVSPGVLNYLVENFHIAPVTTPEEDLKVLLKR